MEQSEKTLDMIVNLCKNRGYVFPGSEIYGGLANSWDYGPLGVEFKNNVKKAWLKKFVQESPYNVGLDAAIIMNPQTWITTGHVSSFSDPLLDCKECKMRHRADTLIENFDPNAHPDKMTKEEMFEFIKAHSIPCPHCGKHNFTDIREFNLMFQTYRGVTNDAKSIIYLRPENAQGEYVNFLNVQRSMRAKLPFSIGQIGKAFRNEITPGNFTFRTIEFEQMEFQTFCKKGSDNELYDYFKQFGKKYFEDLGIAPEHLRFHDHEKLAHYAKAACDIEFLFPFGWGEINGTHNRTDFDLTRHQEYSGQKMDYLDPETNEKFIPYIIESTYGLDRTVLALLCEAYDEEVIDAEKNDTRVVLHLSPVVAPYKAAVLPLSKKLSGEAVRICDELSRKFMVDFDETGSIGKRYRREDEIGTPFCITFDFETVGDENTPADHCVTVRERDTMQQVRMPISEVKAYLREKCAF